ncbi:MAG: DSD1 family PLP-dependent enzyme [Acidobacteria bacterium]|nr:DSD1 family PLP-dependent enzyme [Acidobacteriota bacterium]
MSAYPLKVCDLETPALLLDLSSTQKNIRRMCEFLSGGKCSLRPHFKNHQSPWLASKQIDAGAIGITCATLQQAATLAGHGITNILIASEIAGEAKIRQLVELSKQTEVIVAVDNIRVVSEMARLARDKKTSLNVLVDLDVGLHRCGVQPGEAAVSLARSVVEHGLVLRGIMAYEGHLQHVPGGPEKESAVRACAKLAVESKSLIESQGISCPIVSAGGTGTYSIISRYPGITEVQAGTYVAMDNSSLRFAPEFERALSVLATVISKTGNQRIVVDAGRKALSGERGLPSVKSLKGVELTALHSEHAIIELRDGATAVEVGDKIEIWVQYSDPTVWLHRCMYGIRKGVVAEVLKLEE